MRRISILAGRKSRLEDAPDLGNDDFFKMQSKSKSQLPRVGKRLNSLGFDIEQINFEDPDHGVRIKDNEFVKKASLKQAIKDG